jgi:hypothetical protein
LPVGQEEDVEDERAEVLRLELAVGLDDGLRSKVTKWYTYLRPDFMAIGIILRLFVGTFYIGLFCGSLVYIVVILYILRWFGISCGHLVYRMVIWYISWSFGISHGHLVYLMVIWYILR